MPCNRQAKMLPTTEVYQNNHYLYAWLNHNR